MKVLRLFTGLFVCAIIVISCGRKTHQVHPPGQEQAVRQAADEREILIDFARTLVGSDYKYGGESPRGFDCSGFTRYVYRKIDIELPPQSTLQAERGNKVPLRKARRGDLIFFGPKNRINHVGLVVSNRNGSLEVIHSTSSSGVRIDDVISSEYWNDRIQFAKSLLP